MDAEGLRKTLEGQLPRKLVSDLLHSFLELRRDVLARTLGRSAAGHFVETFAQVLEYLQKGSYSPKPAVEKVFTSIESAAPSLDEGLRICAARLARSMYSLRSKRSIAHKNSIDPSLYDLQLLMVGAQWILAELIRFSSGGSMSEAGMLVEQITSPIGGLVEDFDGKKIVLSSMSIPNELLVLLHSHYPERLTATRCIASLDRRSESSVRDALRRLWSKKLIEGSGKEGYKLTGIGLRASAEAIASAA